MVQKIRKKINNPFLSLMLMDWLTDRQTDRQTDREQWFYRTLHRTGVKKIKFGTECDSHWGGKNNRKLNPFIKTMVNRSNIHYKMNQKRNQKKYIQFPLELQKKWDLPENKFSSAWARAIFELGCLQWPRILRETGSKFSMTWRANLEKKLLKISLQKQIFLFNNSRTREIKDLIKLFNKKIHVTTIW